MPTDALVSPLPNELTTPPVTKMCLAMSPPARPGYRGDPRRSSLYRPAGPKPTEAASRFLRCAGRLHRLGGIRGHESLVIFERIHAAGRLGNDPDLDRI